MKKASAVAVALALLLTGAAARADVFNLGTASNGAVLTNLDTVAVRDAGNAADTRYATLGYGSVGYNYNIGKYEVTAAQYTDFLNNVAKTDIYGLYNTQMTNSWGCNIQRTGSSGSYTYSVAGDWANRPVNYVGYWDACRFVNWLGNGQANGDTETGAYTLNGYNDYDGSTIQRNANWKWAVTSEDEWYKAAYYKAGSTDAGYWDFATQSNDVPSNQVLQTDPGNSANYYDRNYSIATPYFRTSVGEFENSDSAYGTFDQTGNVYELTEALVLDGTPNRGRRGGCFGSRSTYLAASFRSPGNTPTYEIYDSGFRVVQAIPEPSSILALFGGLISLIGIRRRGA